MSIINRILFIVMMLCSPLLRGQETEVVGEKSLLSRLQIGAVISPDFCYRDLRREGHSQSYYDYRESHELAKLGYSGGFELGLFLNKSVSINLGVRYANKGYSWDVSNLTFGSIIVSRRGFIFNSLAPSGSKLQKFVYHYHYLSVPLSVNLKFGSKKLSYMVGAGLSADFLLRSETTYLWESMNGDRDRKTVKESDPDNTFNISPIVSVGLDYSLTDKAYLRFQPNFKYGLLSIADEPFAEFLWTVGGSIGYFRSF